MKIQITWNGSDPSAELEIDGVRVSGDPMDMEKLFYILNMYRKRLERHEQLMKTIRECWDYMENSVFANCG